MSKIPEVKDLLKAGLHFGHKSAAWNPKMGPFLFGAKSGVHVFNLEKTKEMLSVAVEQMERTVALGGIVLFVGTKPQAKEIVKKYALEAGVPYVTERWLGGTLTNFGEIRRLMRKYEQLTKDAVSAEYEQKYTKKERLDFSEEIKKLEKNIGGILTLNKLPDLVFVASAQENIIAVKEAKQCEIPVVGVCDSNINPELVDYCIPGNDDATKSIELVASLMAEAVKVGKKELEKNTIKKAEVVSKKAEAGTKVSS
jgi:small subunit ribosomal protein S2